MISSLTFRGHGQGWVGGVFGWPVVHITSCCRKRSWNGLALGVDQLAAATETGKPSTLNGRDVCVKRAVLSLNPEP